MEQVQLQASNEATALLSIAVSMKRLADTMTGITSVTNDANPVIKAFDALVRHPVNHYGETIGEMIQGQIVRGHRGIDY